MTTDLAARASAGDGPEAGAEEEALSRRADRLMYVGDAREAEAAWLELLRATVGGGELAGPAEALARGDLRGAERVLRPLASRPPVRPDVLVLLAETVGRLGRWDEAEALLAQALAAAPGHAMARLCRIEALLRLGRWRDGLVEIETLLSAEPRHRRARMHKSVVLAQSGDSAGAAALTASLLEDYPDEPRAWLMHGHNLRTVGRTDEAVAAYLKAVALEPGFGEAYWSLANLKTYRFPVEARTAMAAQAAREDLGPDDRCALNFALAKAEEDAGDDAGAFRRYAQGNALHRARIGYDPEQVAGVVRRSRALFTPAYFSERRKPQAAVSSPTPVFIVGLPRSGSTLIDQMLTSHPAVEGLGELNDIASVANWVAGAAPPTARLAYPDPLRRLPSEQLQRLGRAYLDNTAPMRSLKRPLFTDKAPGNWLHVGLILSILPHAKIVDARRHPLGGCLSAFKQHFGLGWEFSYDLTDLGRYYADYVELMRHMDEALPGAVHRVIYEDLVAEPEREVRRLLDYLDLPFDPACLRFYENDRAVNTPSSEQVRRPIFAGGVDQWRRMEPWLDSLKAALGPALTHYRDDR